MRWTNAGETMSEWGEDADATRKQELWGREKMWTWVIWQKGEVHREEQTMREEGRQVPSP